MKVLKESLSKVGSNRGRKRIWIEGRKLELAGLYAGKKYTLKIDKKERKFLLIPSLNGNLKVSKKKIDHPVIDINSTLVGETFKTEKVKVKIFNDHIEISEALLES